MRPYYGALGTRAGRGAVVFGVREWGRVGWAFVVIEAKCLLFPLLILFGLALTRRFGVPGVARYDTMLVYCLLIQWALVRRGMETVSELRAICVFHALGLILEIHRTSIGAWSYPDPGRLRLGAVPLFSGFMYAGVASYLLQAWRRFDLRFERLPAPWIGVPLAVGSYLSFFFVRGARIALIGLILLAFVRTWVFFTVAGRTLRMPLGLAFGLIGGAVWIGENLGTFFYGWRYADQANGWRMVAGTKAAAWFLLIVVGFTVMERFKTWERGGRRALRPGFQSE